MLTNDMISDASVLSPESGNGLKTPGKVTKFHDRKKARRRSNIILYTILSLVAVLMVLPTLVMLCSSLKSYDDYYSLQFHLLPRTECISITTLVCLLPAKISCCGLATRCF